MVWFIQQTEWNIVIRRLTGDQIKIGYVNSLYGTMTKYLRETTKGEVIILILAMTSGVHSIRVR